ncbi:MAG: hypothetical protein EZS28_034961 [Streblomastix strix]|uniref:Uncharacterized protein n=1 Tax=Streblomastix strix TaxID=222440 RepID=A0A5J4UHV3_9EUKA|nr:MAG: hypothetical protein EZS28_034961 [Streblomastix strix]
MQFNAPESYSQQQLDALLLLKADKTELINAYSKTEDDALLLLKADKTELINSYTKTETEIKLELKVNVSNTVDSYSKSEDDSLLLLNADKTELIDTYCKSETNSKDKIYAKSEDDAFLLLKANQTYQTNQVDLTSTLTISGLKQIIIISASIISKLSKNDASILFAGSSDKLVSSLVAQPQLQEIKVIAAGKSKAYVFSTKEELNDWIFIQDNITKLVIGDNLYIVDKEVIDYLWDRTDLKLLETELFDLNNVNITLGAAIGGRYDNSSVLLDDRGVKSISDINVRVSYTKDEDDALLPLKADKTQLIESYSKSERYVILDGAGGVMELLILSIVQTKVYIEVFIQVFG